MNYFLGILTWIFVFVCYFSVEFIINIFFTYKIKYISKDDYKKAAFAGSTSTFLFMFSTLLAAILGSNLVDGNTKFSHYFLDKWVVFLFWTTFSLSMGNFWATLTIPILDRKFKKRKEKKEEK
ncbi:MAG: hypothetical protein TYPL_2540 [Candidatus Tyloplasma litorale]|nr:MAG: hypothetical protein TYPL_2540 [Mycoplasmatales bacterium]